jgi:hypothetical protein
MKKSILIAFCFYFFQFHPTFSQNSDSNILETPFAKIEDNGYDFIIDPLQFKMSVSDELFSKESKGTYDKIEIKKAYTVGESYYFVLLTHYEKKLKTARYLKNEDDILYLITDNDFGSIYISCIGTDKKCSPNLIIDKKNMSWMCSDKIGVCLLDENECKSIKSIILE